MLDGLAVLAFEDVRVLPPLGLAVASTASFSSASSSIASSEVVDALAPSLRLRVKRDPSFFIMLLLLLLLCTLLLGLLEMVLLLPLDEGRRGSSIPSSDRLDKLLFELSLREECGVERVGRLDRRDAASIVPVCLCGCGVVMVQSAA